MNLELSEEQKILGESVARFCKAEISMETVRRLADHPKGMPDELWQKIAEQAWLGVMIPEPYGGLGLGVTELGIILEEMGRALVPGPYFATAALGAPAIVLGGNEALKSPLAGKNRRRRNEGDRRDSRRRRPAWPGARQGHCGKEQRGVRSQREEVLCP